MILATVLTAYFVFLICQQTADIAQSRRLYTDSCIRRGMLSKHDIVRISHKRFSSIHYNGLPFYNEFTSCRFFLSSNGRLYKHEFHKGHKRVNFYSYSDALRVMYFTATKPQREYNRVYNVHVSFNTLTYTEPSFGSL